MIIRNLEVANLMLLALVLASIYSRSTRNIIFSLFLYATLHFSYSAWPLIAGMPLSEIVEIHLKGSGLIATISAMVVMLTGLLWLLSDNWRVLSDDRGLLSVFVVCGALVTCGYALNVEQGNLLQFKNFVATIFMLALIFLMSLAGRSNFNLNTVELTAVVVIVLAIVLIGLLEVYSLRAWATFADSSGQIILRASSLLFNPNLFALWCSTISLASAYMFQRLKRGGGLMLTLFAITMIGLYLSGSRGLTLALLVIWVCVSIAASCLHGLRRWAPLLTMLIVFMSMSSISWLMSVLVEENQSGWHALALLGQRFSTSVIDLVNYALNHIAILDFSTKQITPVEIVDSIEGRFVGELRDAGWLVSYDDAGSLGSLGMLVLWSYFTYLGLSIYRQTASIASIYALAALVFSVMVGWLMRFQAFPTGVFFAFLLAPCIGYWKREKSRINIQQVNNLR